MILVQDGNMSKEYIRTKEMHGEKPFRCQNCSKKMITHIEGHFRVKLDCPRCKAIVIVIMKEAVPEALVELVKEE